MTQTPKDIFSLTIAALAFALPGCTGASRSDPPIVEPVAKPVTPTPPVEPTSTPTIENPAYTEAAAYSASHGGLALVVIEGDRVALAIGQNGHELDEAHPLHGASESFWGPATVAADHEDLLDIDEPVAFTIEEWEDVRWKGDMRIRQLLQYTSGLESGVYPLLREKPANQYERALSLEMVAAPGERFQAGPSHLAVLGEVLRRKLAPKGFDPLSYLEAQILDPIGLEIESWERDAAGNPDLANGARMTASEWVKFGILIRDRGSWNGEPVLEAAGIEACLEPSEVQPRFGLTFWLNPGESSTTKLRATTADPSAGQPEELGDVVMAAGAGNQRLYVIRSLNLVVARFGNDGRDWRDPVFLELIAKAAASDS
jgi:CubicO group peptidase (beta-lactamase class C family)